MIDSEPEPETRRVEMDREEIQRLAKRYHLLPNSLKVQAYALFEQGLKPVDIIREGLLPQLQFITIYAYYGEWKRKQ